MIKHNIDAKVKIFKGFDDLYHYLYKITNLDSGKIYIGAHSTNNLNDGYCGSGKYLQFDYKLLGKSKFCKEFLEFFNTRDELLKREAEIVNLEFVLSENTYNSTTGGKSCVKNGFSFYKRKSNSKEVIFTTPDDERVLSGEFVGVTFGYNSYRNKITGKIVRLTTEEFRRNEDLYEGLTNGKTAFLNTKTGKIELLEVEDERIKTGEFVGVTKGKTTCKNIKTGKIMCRNNEEFSNNDELVGVRKGMVNVKDKESGKVVYISSDEYQNAKDKFEHAFTGKVTYFNTILNKIVNYDKNSDEFKDLLAQGVLIHQNKNKITIFNTETQTKERIDLSEENIEKLKKGVFVYHTKGYSTYKLASNYKVKLQLHISDPRIKSGEVLGSTKNCFVMIKPGEKSKIVEYYEVENLLNLGYDFKSKTSVKRYQKLLKEFS